MDSFTKYSDWLDKNLSKDKREKFEFIQAIAVHYSSLRLWGLIEQYNIRKNFALYKFGSLERFVKDELFNATKELTQIPLFIDWEGLNYEIKRIQKFDSKATRRDEYFSPDYLEGKMYVFFRDIIYFSPIIPDLASQYLCQEIDVKSRPADYDTSNLKDFDKVVDLMARFQWLINIMRVVDSGEYENDIKKPIRNLTFESLFRNTDHAHKVKELFETRGYTVTGKWQGLTDAKTELLCAYRVLKDLEFLKPGSKITPTAKIFYSEFGLPEDYISDRMLRNYPKNHETLKEFENLFSSLLRSNK